jgi:hypothetical protein
MYVRSSWLALAVGALVMLAAGLASAKEPQYVGAKKCKSCHKKELMGNQYGEWEKGVHHKAFETLKSDDAVKIAAEKGISGPPHESADCLKCHVTAYGEDAARFAKKRLLSPADGIQCESCHGPGSLYRKKKVMSDRDKSVAAGMWEPEKDAKICTACHNDESPTWDAAKGFDHEARMEEIAHLIPEDVKGHYLELEKKRKAEKGGATTTRRRKTSRARRRCR